MQVTETTAGWNGSTLRATMCCRLMTAWAATTTGSTTRCGWAACPPLPRMVMVNWSGAAMSGPSLTPTCPTGARSHRCAPITRSTPPSTPARTSSSAPPGASSSACWKTKRTSPESSSFRSTSTWTAPSSIAVCPSWPQACIAPSLSETNSWVFFSTIGSASMSARIASTGPRLGPPRPAAGARFGRPRDRGAAEPGEGVGDELRGPLLVEGQLGVLMQMAAPADDGLAHRVDGGFGGGGGGTGCLRIRGPGGEDDSTITPPPGSREGGERHPRLESPTRIRYRVESVCRGGNHATEVRWPDRDRRRAGLLRPLGCYRPDVLSPTLSPADRRHHPPHRRRHREPGPRRDHPFDTPGGGRQPLR